MPAVAQEFDHVAPGLLIWQVYDRVLKADLSSSALETPGGTYLVDPLELTRDALHNLLEGRTIAGIVITNVNHERATQWFADRFSVPIYLHPAAKEALGIPQPVPLRNNDEIEPGLRTIPIEGAPSGEIALHFEGGGGTLVMGDALINFEPHGFGFLPAKYCLDYKLMRRSLPKLLNYKFERMVFAHGTPMLSNARERLENLLAENA